MPVTVHGTIDHLARILDKSSSIRKSVRDLRVIGRGVESPNRAIREKTCMEPGQFSPRSFASALVNLQNLHELAVHDVPWNIGDLWTIMTPLRYLATLRINCVLLNCSLVQFVGIFRRLPALEVLDINRVEFGSDFRVEDNAVIKGPPPPRIHELLCSTSEETDSISLLAIQKALPMTMLRTLDIQCSNAGDVAAAGNIIQSAGSRLRYLTLRISNHALNELGPDQCDRLLHLTSCTSVHAFNIFLQPFSHPSSTGQLLLLNLESFSAHPIHTISISIEELTDTWAQNKIQELLSRWPWADIDDALGELGCLEKVEFRIATMSRDPFFCTGMRDTMRDFIGHMLPQLNAAGLLSFPGDY